MLKRPRLLRLVLPLLLVVLLTLPAMSWLRQPETDQRQSAQRVNLALRRVADRLLDLAGDSTTAIPPVDRVAANEYRLRLQRNFNYDSLPDLLERAFALYQLTDDYYVSVTTCGTDELMLGYAKADLAEGIPPCGGREHKAGCYDLSVVFSDQQTPTPWKAGIWLGLLVIGLLLPSLLYWRRRPSPEAEPAPATDDDAWQRFGRSAFDLGNQSLLIGGQHHSLTFREAKLLHFFLQHPNQLLPREDIMAAVWEDEGIIVGRSLDVFVSRLRKVLRPDPTVRIANVHGVGYRLEVDQD